MRGTGSVEIQRLARDLHRMGPAGQRALKRRFRGVAQPLLAAARANASWSTRIPGAISVRSVASASSVRIGVQLRSSAKKAPHARPYEGLGQGGVFRHPVFGRRDAKWVEQKTRPFLYPAVREKGDDAGRALLDAYEDAAREAGFR